MLLAAIHARKDTSWTNWEQQRVANVRSEPKPQQKTKSRATSAKRENSRSSHMDTHARTHARATYNTHIHARTKSKQSNNLCIHACPPLSTRTPWVARAVNNAPKAHSRVNKANLPANHARRASTHPAPARILARRAQRGNIRCVCVCVCVFVFERCDFLVRYLVSDLILSVPATRTNFFTHARA